MKTIQIKYATMIEAEYLMALTELGSAHQEWYESVLNKTTTNYQFVNNQHLLEIAMYSSAISVTCGLAGQERWVAYTGTSVLSSAKCSGPTMELAVWRLHLRDRLGVHEVEVPETLERVSLLPDFSAQPMAPTTLMLKAANREAERWREAYEAIPEIPLENTQKATDAIAAVMAEYQWPCNPANAARVGWRAARLWMERKEKNAS